MRTIGRWKVFCALAATATLLAGCGDDDGGEDGSEVIVTVPFQSEPGMRALSYWLYPAGSDTGGDAIPRVLTFPAENRYRITEEAETVEGSYSNPIITANQLVVTLTPDDPEEEAGVLTMTFERARPGGTYAFNPTSGPAEQGTFTYAELNPNPNPEPSGDNAPGNIVGSWNLDVQTGPFTGQFIATYDSSNFTIVRASDGNPSGSGTYTYTRSTEDTDEATLVHNYSGDFAGDVDQFELDFSTPVTATFNGTIVSPPGSPPQAASGTFTK